jgi:aminopeptidase N
MIAKTGLLPLLFLMLPFLADAQLGAKKDQFTRQDTLRGSISKERAWWNVLRYDVTVTPDYVSKTIIGKTDLGFYDSGTGKVMQIDLQEPMILDSAVSERKQLTFTREGNVYWLNFRDADKTYKIKPGKRKITFYFHGKPKEALRAPWDGGWIWKKDEKGRPWMSVACQGLGASVWYPCKDHQSDEPENGASLTMIVPDTLTAVANGRLISQKNMGNGLKLFSWEVKNPINSYNLVPYIGKYVNWTDTLKGEKGKLDLSYWVLDYNLEKAKNQFQQVKPMFRAFEYWFGPYPFYEDSYKLVDAPHLGMEHQSAVAYGNKYLNGYLGRDQSGTGVGMKWDFIIIHESGHEWFANNITSRDIADMWVHEGFTAFSETLFSDYHYGAKAGNDYCVGVRKNIQNDRPIIGPYGVNKEGSGDMYYKAENMLQTIRHAINNDAKFRSILRGLNKTYYHSIVTSKQVEDYVSKQSGINFSKVFDQYLRTTDIPVLEYKLGDDGKEIEYRYTKVVDGFDLPLRLANGKTFIPKKDKWQKLKLKDASEWDAAYLVDQYYIGVKND